MGLVTRGLVVEGWNFLPSFWPLGGQGWALS